MMFLSKLIFFVFILSSCFDFRVLSEGMLDPMEKLRV
jgi:hypothetical protein